MSTRNYQRRLWQFHRRNFFDFDRALSATELRYIGTCQNAIAWSRVNEHGAETSPFGYRHFSSYTYSHRVQGEHVNSSRIAFGSVARSEEVRPAALEVLGHRGVAVDPVYLGNAASFFYGLGWDVEADQFKVYFRVLHEQFPLPDRHASLLALAGVGIRPEILVSFTYTGREVAEEKVYAYPATLQGACMISTRRGVVEQADVRDAAAWAERLNGAGRDIISRYAEIGDSLDTIAYQDPDHFTLYFP